MEQKASPDLSRLRAALRGVNSVGPEGLTGSSVRELLSLALLYAAEDSTAMVRRDIFERALAATGQGPDAVVLHLNELIAPGNTWPAGAPTDLSAWIDNMERQIALIPD